MPNEPSFASWLECQPAHLICDDAQTHAVRAGKGHESAREQEAGRRVLRGPDELDPLKNHRGVEPRCMAGARGKAPAVVRS